MATTNTAAGKGDWALAAAFAKGGLKISTGRSLQFNVGLNLGGLTLTAALDPGIGFFDVFVTDLDLDHINEDVLNDTMKQKFIDNGMGSKLAKPTDIFYELHIDFNAQTGIYHVVNSSNYMSPDALLTADDFEIGVFNDKDIDGNTILRPGIRLKDSLKGNIVLQGLPSNYPDDTFLSIDVMQFERAVPEPGTIMLLMAAFPFLLYRGVQNVKPKKAAPPANPLD